MADGSCTSELMVPSEADAPAPSTLPPTAPSSAPSSARPPGSMPRGPDRGRRDNSCDGSSSTSRKGSSRERPPPAGASGGRAAWVGSAGGGAPGSSIAARRGALRSDDGGRPGGRVGTPPPERSGPAPSSAVARSCPRPAPGRATWRGPGGRSGATAESPPPRSGSGVRSLTTGRPFVAPEWRIVGRRLAVADGAGNAGPARRVRPIPPPTPRDGTSSSPCRNPPCCNPSGGSLNTAIVRRRCHRARLPLCRRHGTGAARCARAVPRPAVDRPGRVGE